MEPPLPLMLHLLRIQSRINAYIQNYCCFTALGRLPVSAHKRALKQRQFEYAYLFAAVCPATGATEALIAPYIDMSIMRKHLQLIAERTEFERHAVIIVDGAAWHQEYIAEEFSNITLIKLPPYSPELNPIEQVCSWLRQNELANRCFNGYEDIVNACSRAWNSFVSNLDRVQKLGSEIG